jgi:hypothetical protein
VISEEELRQALSEIALEADAAGHDHSQDVVEFTAAEIAKPERRRRTWWFPAAAAATVAACVITVVTLSGHRAGVATPPTSRRPAATAKPLAGTDWQLTEVRSAHVIHGTRSKAWQVPRPYLVGLAFRADGRLNGRELFSTFTGRYHTSGNRIMLHGSAIGRLPGSKSFGTPAEAALSSVLAPTSSLADSVTSTFSLTATTLTVTGSRWTLRFRALGAAASYCLDNPPMRTGTATSLVPATPTAVTICSIGRARLARTVTDIAELVHALDALPTSPVASTCETHGSSAVPSSGVYDLHFHYQSGPDVLVSVQAQCARPPGSIIDNPRLQAAFSPATVIPLIKAELGNPPK